FTILTGLPYDRPQTTMAGFPMCPACDKEYNNPADRRFHAQPIACPDCGPAIWYTTLDSNRHLQVSRPQTGLLSSAAITAAQQHLHEGRLVAVKGVGGFHLACDATHPEAVATLRRRKQRPRKPFAVMVPTVAAAAALAEVNEQAAAFLSSPARPIVLLPKRCPQAVTLAECVAPESPFLGVMLPSSPLHELLFQQSAAADNTSSLQVLVMTSGNFAGEPITTDNMLAAERLGSIADGFLMHDRPIHAACDDSVVRCVAGLPMPIRLARGHAPRTLQLPDEGPCVLAVGGDLKATLCLASGQQAILSQHLGDQASPATLELFTTTARQLLALTHATPERV
ncbi:carbamoyltransferase HypF, partial [bacterium]|nr:carbamoyltransferase HypF [bacterium]